MPLSALKYAFRVMVARKGQLYQLALPLMAIYVSLMALHKMFDHALGLFYRTLADFFGIEFLIMPFVLGLFAVGWLKVLTRGKRQQSVPHPFRLSGADKHLFGSALFFYFIILNLPFLVTGLWGWLGPDHLQGWLGGKGVLFGAATLAAAFLMTEQILLFPALADGREWVMGQAAQASEGVKLELFLAVAPVGVAGWLLVQAPLWAPVMLGVAELSGFAYAAWMAVCILFGAVIAFICTALWCGITVYFFRKLERNPRKAELFDPGNAQDVG